jgi:hypothetical protein
LCRTGHNLNTLPYQAGEDKPEQGRQRNRIATLLHFFVGLAFSLAFGLAFSLISSAEKST